MPNARPRVRWLVANVWPDVDENPAGLTPDMVDYAECPWRAYVHEIMTELEWIPPTERPTFREVYEEAKSRHDRDLAGSAVRHPYNQSWFEPDRGTHRDVIYYVRMDRLVKIGTTHRIRSRMADLMPQGILALEFGDRDLERQRHNQFAGQHSHGEWFRMNSDLWAHIVDARARFEGEAGMTVEDWLRRHRVPERAVLADPIDQ